MSRLNYLLDHELAIQTILDELPILEKHVAAGGKFASADIRDLVSGLSRLAGIVQSVEHSEEPGWDADNEPLPPWLQLKPVDNKWPATFPGEKDIELASPFHIRKQVYR